MEPKVPGLPVGPLPGILVEPKVPGVPVGPLPGILVEPKVPGLPGTPVPGILVEPKVPGVPVGPLPGMLGPRPVGPLPGPRPVPRRLGKSKSGILKPEPEPPEEANNCAKSDKHCLLIFEISTVTGSMILCIKSGSGDAT